MAQKFDVKGLVTAWNTHNADRICEYYADDAEVIVPPDAEAYRGKEGVRRNVEEVTKGIEDLNCDLAWSVQEGARVSALMHITGRHTGEMVVSDRLKIAATNRDIKFMLGMFIELDDKGKIRRETDIADNVGILQQVGAMERLSAGTGPR